MIMEDNEILQEFFTTRNLKQRTIVGYKDAVRIYKEFTGLTLQLLFDEAEKEEEKGVRWKHRKFKKRLIGFRTYLQNKYAIGTAKIHFQRIKSLYLHFEIEIHQLPVVSKVNVSQNVINFNDIPNIEIIEKALKIANPLMRAMILFISSSGCARRETLNLTVGDFIGATKQYHGKDDVYEALNILKDREDIILTFHLNRQKTNKQYFTFCSPEASTAITYYLLDKSTKLQPEMKLFKINLKYLNNLFHEINDKLSLGKAGPYNRFRSHILRKFHAVQLYNDGMSMEDVDSLQVEVKTPLIQAISLMIHKSSEKNIPNI